MSIVLSILNVWLGISVVLSVAFVFYGFQRRITPGIPYFVMLVGAILIYNFGYLMELNSSTLEMALFWFNFEHIGLCAQPYLWFMMSLSYSGFLKKYFKFIRLIALVHPATYYAIYFTNPLHHLYGKNFHFVYNGFFML